MLQDSNLIHKAKNRRIMLRNTYQRSVVAFSERFPEDIELSKYTYELFLFAWFCVQNREPSEEASWTAMVPFADCLNHSNVQTKYDYDVNGNGLLECIPQAATVTPKVAKSSITTEGGLTIIPPPGLWIFDDLQHVGQCRIYIGSRQRHGGVH